MFEQHHTFYAPINFKLHVDVRSAHLLAPQTSSYRRSRHRLISNVNQPNSLLLIDGAYYSKLTPLMSNNI